MEGSNRDGVHPASLMPSPSTQPQGSGASGWPSPSNAPVPLGANVDSSNGQPLHARKCLEWQESIGKNWDKHLDLGVLWGTYVERNPVSRIQEFHLNQTHLASDGRRPLWRHLQPCVGVKQNIGRLTWQWTNKSGTIASSGKLVSREFGTSNRCSCSILS